MTPFAELNRLSPSARRLARIDGDEIASLGMPRKRGASIHAVASASASGQLSLVPGLDPATAREQLVQFNGIGEWTAAYVAMRALADPDAIPIADLGIRKALGLSRDKDVEARTVAWRPWRAYAAIYLWLSLGGA